MYWDVEYHNFIILCLLSHNAYHDVIEASNCNRPLKRQYSVALQVTGNGTRRALALSLNG